MHTPSPSRAHLRKRGIELLALFALAPVLYALLHTSLPLIPFMLGAALLARFFYHKRRDTHASSPTKHQVLNTTLETALASILLLFIAQVIGLSHPTWLTSTWFALPLAFVLYTLLSALPQEFIFRVFFFARYRALFSSPRALALVSAAAFGFAHVVLRNPIAVLLSFFGGLLIAHTYARTGSYWLATLQHGVLGLAIFFSGFGPCFWSGAEEAFGASCSVARDGSITVPEDRWE